MMFQIKRWLAPPVFPDDDDKTRRANLLNFTLLTLVALMLCFIAGNLAGGTVSPAVSGVDIVFVAACFLLRRWVYQGRIRLAGSALSAVGLVVITMAVAMLGTIRTPATAAYVLAVITAGLLFDLSGMLLMAALCSLAVAGLIVAENAGLLPRPDYSVGITQWVTYAALFAWAGGLTFSAVQSVRQVLARANQEIAARLRAEEESHRAKALTEEAHRELQQAFAREQNLARTDALTSVNNRRYWFELAEHEFEVATRYHHTLAVILFDIDYFKLVNDMFGHAVGDQMLERVAQVARAALRSVDVIGRYGGEEFVIVLPVTTASQAYLVAERIRAGIAAIRVPTPNGDAAVALSIGISERLPAPLTERLGGDDSVERVIQRADEAMYAAKAAGRNRTSIHSAPAERPGGSA